MPSAPQPWPTPKKPQLDLRDVGALGKWAGIGLAIGALAGAASLLFLALIALMQRLLLEGMAGYSLQESAASVVVLVKHLWVLPLLAAGGGFLSGLLLHLTAPEASGIGTDAVVKSFHHGKPVPLRVAALKMVSSAMTLGFGGTSGTEGPIAQVGAGLGSTIARAFRLDARDRTIAMCAGLGAGIAAAFKAPLAGAIISVEVFYHEDFEVEALLPSLFAAVVAYSVTGFVVGWQPLYATHLDPYSFGNPLSLLLFAVLGAFCALLARGAFAVFAPIQAAAKRMPLWASAPIGATLASTLAIAAVFTIGLPTPIGSGHPWLQGLLSGALQVHGPLVLALLAIAALEVLANALTIGMGNSGGIFGPSLVAGGFLGGAFALVAAKVVPGLVPEPSLYVVVGMIAYFAAAVKAPVGTIVMVAEITGGYGLLAPAMVAVVVSYTLSGRKSLFPSQVRSRLDSPAKAHDFEPLVLKRVHVRDALEPTLLHVTPGTSLDEAAAMMAKTNRTIVPVLDQETLVGLLASRDVERVPAPERAGRVVRDVLPQAPAPAAVGPDDDLFFALTQMLERDVEVLPVVKGTRYLGLVGLRHVHNVLAAARPPAQKA